MIMLKRLTGIGGGIEIHEVLLEELALVYDVNIRLSGKVGEFKLQNYFSVLVQYLEGSKSRGPIGPYGEEPPSLPDSNIFVRLSYHQTYYLQNRLRVGVPLIAIATDKETKLEFGFAEDEESHLVLSVRGHLDGIKEFAKFLSQSYDGRTELAIKQVYMEGLK